MSAGPKATAGSASAADRRPPKVWLLAGSVGLSMAALAMLLASAGRVGAVPALASGLSLAVLLVLGLPSLGPSRGALVAQGIGLLALLRTLAVPGADPSWLLLWIVGAVATLVLVVSASTDEAPMTDGAAQGSTGRALRTAGVVAVLVVLATLVFGPPVAERARAASSVIGNDPNYDASGVPLFSADFLDMTQRPRLDNTIVMTVRSPAPSFWRGQVYDAWDGRRWTRSDQAARLVGQATGDVTLVASPDDLGATLGRPLRQTYRMVAAGANLLFAAPSPVEVDAPVRVVQRTDGTLLGDTMGMGSTYTVVSKRAIVTRERLAAAAGPIPTSIVDRYAAPPVATLRTLAAARRITALATTELGKVDAVERFMAATTKYSITSPTARPGVDVVDDFLFNTKRGWCEQIASSLVVLLRAVGVPARLATGFVPGDPNPLTDTYTVRAKHAHAWAEVWFPGLGWQSFDPTASVPLSGEQGPTTVFGWLGRHGLEVVAAVILLALLVALVRRLPARRTRRGRGTGWDGRTLRRLEKLGRAADRPRRPHETATAYGGALASALDDADLAAVGRLVDDDRYGPAPVPPPERARADAALARAESR